MKSGHFEGSRTRICQFGCFSTKYLDNTQFIPSFFILNESSGHRWRQLRTSTNPQVLNITHSFWANSFKRLKNKKTQRIILYFQLEMDDKADQMITDLLTHGAFGLQRKNWGQFNTHPAVMIGYLIPM